MSNCSDIWLINEIQGHIETQKYKHKEYPQVRKTGVDADMKVAHRGPTCERL